MKTAIVFFPYTEKRHPRKYHNISHTFDAFCESIGAHHYNLYDAKTKKFIKREYVGKHKINRP
jgi:hypothetical protein